jgi:GH15 family glucan-1,4-alpha-glucosidase
LFPAKDVVDAGFLELVRYGIRQPGDSNIVDSLKVVDAVLKVDTPFGPSWRRYNHDGYGQQEDGGPFVAGDTAALGRCSRENEGTMNWPPATIPRRSFGPSKTWHRTPAC